MATTTARELDATAYTFLRTTNPLTEASQYKGWKMRMLRAFGLAEVKGVVDGTEDKPANDAEAATEWDRKDGRAFAILASRLGDEDLNQVSEAATTKEAWDFLADKYELSKVDSIRALNSSFTLVKAKNDAEIPDFLSKHETLLAEAKKVHHPLVRSSPPGATDATKEETLSLNLVYVGNVLGGLPNTIDWRMFVKQYEGSKSNEFTPRECLDAIRSEYQQRLARTVSATQNPLLNPSSKSSDAALATGKGTPRPKCPFCGQKKPNHSPEKCWQNAANPDNKIGEKAKKEEKKEGGGKKSSGKGKAAAAVSKDDDDAPDITHLTIAGAVAEDEDHDPNDWFLDSCATSSVAHSRSSFVEYKTVDKAIQTAAGKDMKVVGVGNVEFGVKTTGGGIKKVTLTGVYHVPSSAYNLVSLPKLLTNGCTSAFLPNSTFTVSLNGKLVFSGFRHPNGLPKLALVPPSSVANAILPSADERLDRVKHVHRVYGHPGKGAMRDMLRRGIFTGVTTTDLDKFFSTTCEVCV